MGPLTNQHHSAETHRPEAGPTPRALPRGYDFLVQALAGFMSVTGDPDDAPTRCGVSIVDFSGGLMSAVGMLIGLLRARATGIGCDVDISLLDTAVSMLNYLAVWSLNRGLRLQRLPDGAHQTLVPSQTFPTTSPARACVSRQHAPA